MGYLREYDWDALSPYVAPKDVAEFLRRRGGFGINADGEAREGGTAFWGSVESLQRCWRTVVANMYSSLPEEVRAMVEVRGVAAEEIFTVFLPSRGYIPSAGSRDFPNNDLFGYRHGGEWKEWGCPTLKIMRMYWDKIGGRAPNSSPTGTGGAHAKASARFQAAVRAVASFLPGEKALCQQCTWEVPLSEMHHATICCYCFDRQANLFQKLVRTGTHTVACHQHPHSLVL